MANYVTGESRARGPQIVDSGDGARLFADGGKFQTKEQMLPPLPSIQPADAEVQLTADQKLSYEKHGYTVCPGLISSSDTVELRLAVDEMMAQAVGLPCAQTEMFDFEPSHTPEGEPRVRRIKRPDRHSEPFNRLLRNQRLMGVVAQLLGPNVRHQNIKLNIKAAEYGSPVEWHQVSDMPSCPQLAALRSLRNRAK